MGYFRLYCSYTLKIKTQIHLMMAEITRFQLWVARRIGLFLVAFATRCAATGVSQILRLAAISSKTSVRTS